MAKLLVGILALSLLIFAGGGGSGSAHAAATPRTIPWDCSDWQAAAAVEDAEDVRVSVILESLATNRGKTLYCGVDQSDTFTKTETWEAGKDRNERDDTVYYGENGRFRGFLAAQEGYLTDGESGVTGISRDRVFEFPEEPRKRRKRVRTFQLCPDLVFSDDAPQHPPYSPCVLQTGLHSTAGVANSDRATALDNAGGEWSNLAGRPAAVNTADKYNAWIRVSARQADANAKADAECRAAGGRRRGAARILSADGSNANVRPYFSENQGGVGSYQFQVGIQIYFEATCRRR